MPAITQPSSSDFEVTLANLAHAQLRDKATSLFDHLLGFEVVDVNEDQTHALGVFGFKLGEQMLFVPVFYLNGELKCNFMYLPDQDLFLPLKDKWISYLINRQPFELGKREPRREQELGVMAPDLRRVSGNVTPGYDMFQTRTASDLGSVPVLFTRVRDTTSLPVFLEKTAEYGTVELFLKAMQSNERLAQVVNNVYPLDTLITKSALEASSQRRIPVRKSASAPLRDIFDVSDGFNNRQVSVLFGADSAFHVTDDAARTALLSGDFVVFDKRSSTNKIYKRGAYELSNPDVSGKYELLRSNNEFTPVWVFSGIKPIGEGLPHAVLVYAPELNSARYEWVQNLWCKPILGDHHDSAAALDEFPSADSAEIDDVGFLATKGLAASILFRVVRKDRHSDGLLRLVVEPLNGSPPSSNPTFFNTDTHKAKGWVDQFLNEAFVPNSYSEDRTENRRGTEGAWIREHAPRSDVDNYPTAASSAISQIVITEDDRNMRVIGQTLFAPKSARFIKLNKTDRKPGDVDWAQLDPGSLIQFEIGLHKSGMELFTVKRDHSNAYYVNNVGPFTRERVVLAAIKKSGADLADAKALVAIQPGQCGEWWVKTSSVFSPPMPEPGMGFDNYAGVPEQYDMSVHMPGPQNDQNDQAYLGKAEVNQLIQAAQQGQKNVFDTSAIGSLLKTIDNEQLVGRYLGDLVLGLDRVNRILCIYYWFGDKFRDRYGSENLPELEDQLLGVSNSLGDLIMFLKQRKIDAGSQVDELELKLGTRA